MTSNHTIRNLVIEEIDRITYRSIDLNRVLERDEIRALRTLEEKARSLNEQDLDVLTNLAWKVLTSKIGRKILLAILKVIKTVASAPTTALNMITVPMFDKALNFLNGKGMKIPFSAQQIFDVIKFVFPTTLVSYTVGELVDMIADMSDDEYHHMVNLGKSAHDSAKSASSPEPKAQLAERYIHIELQRRR